MITTPTEDFVKLAKMQLGIMRQRSLFFSQSKLFGDTSWELLLEIFVACEERDLVPAVELMETVTAQRPIVHRWLRVFEDCGYIKILQDQSAGMITITEDAREECISFLVTLGNQDRLSG